MNKEIVKGIIDEAIDNLLAKQPDIFNFTSQRGYYWR